MLQRLLVPLDGSGLSERAVPHAAELAERLSMPVTLLFVVDGWDKVAQTLARSNGELDREAHSRMLRSSDTALDAVRGYLTGQARRFEAPRATWVPRSWSARRQMQSWRSRNASRARSW